MRPESGNHRAELDAIGWLIGVYLVGPIPLDVTISRAEQFLDRASADPWTQAEILQGLGVLHAQAGRIADARAAVVTMNSIQFLHPAHLIRCFATVLAGLTGSLLAPATGSPATFA